MPLRSWVVTTIASPSSVQVVEQVQHLVAGVHVDTRCGLVEQQQVGAAEQGAGDEHPLLLSARQLLDVAPAEPFDAESTEDPCAPRRARHGSARAVLPAAAQARRARHEDAFRNRDRETPVDLFDLRDVADPEAVALAPRCRPRANRPEESLRSVVLPDPDGPTTPVNRDAAISRSTPRSTGAPP